MEPEFAGRRICKRGLEGQQGTRRFPVTNPLHSTGGSFIASVHWPSPMNSAITGALHVTPLPCTPKLLPLTSQHRTAWVSNDPLPTPSCLAAKSIS